MKSNVMNKALERLVADKLTAQKKYALVARYDRQRDLPKVLPNGCFERVELAEHHQAVKNTKRNIQNLETRIREIRKFQSRNQNWNYSVRNNYLMAQHTSKALAGEQKVLLSLLENKRNAA